MEAVVEAVSNKFGPSVLLARADGKDWYKPSKFGPQVDLLSLAKGDKVDFTADGKYIKAIAKTGTAPVAARPATVSGGPAMTDEVQGNIARSTALKSVWGSPAVAQLTQQMDQAEAVSLMRELTEANAGYILTGKFSPTP